MASEGERVVGPSDEPNTPRSILAQALAACGKVFVAIAIMSGVINVLALTGPFFMLEVYDRVLPSRSLPTLVGLAVIAVVLYVFYGLLDLFRTRILVRTGALLDQKIGPAAYGLLWRSPLRIGGTTDPRQALRDLDQVRSFLSGMGPTAVFDLPWMPLYIGICFAFHPLLGIAATISALILIMVTLLTEVFARRPVAMIVEHASRRAALAEAAVRNAEVMQAMGMAPQMQAAYAASNNRLLGTQLRAADIGNGFGVLSKVLRLALQSGILGIGAWLVLRQEATAGIIIAGSILTARALAPVELALLHWRSFLAARQSWRRLDEALRRFPAESPPMSLPAPTSSLSVEAVTVVPPGSRHPAISGVTFRLKAGNGLGIVGPSGSGKSSLLRALVGAWVPAAGRVTLDAAALDQWPPAQLGRTIGYLPQDVELFAGSVADNISRFDPSADSSEIVAAAQAADAHKLIVGQLQGYDAQIGEGGAFLSAGQRQRIGLARALYGNPFLIVLDEPNSNLDAEGEEALTRAILAARQRGAIIVLAAHRPSTLMTVDLVMVVTGGHVQAFGPRDQVLSKMVRRPMHSVAPAPASQTKPAGR